MSHRRFSITVATIAGIFCAIPAYATDFYILRVDQNASQQLAEPAVATVLINGGYEDGLESGLTGDLWVITSREEGSRRLGGASVQTVTATEASCVVVMDSGHSIVSPDLRVSIVPLSGDPAAMLERAEEAYQQGDFEHALFCFNKVQWLIPDNPIVKEHTPTCRRLVDSAKAAGLSETQRQTEKARLQEYIDLAHKYIKIRDDEMAWRYFSRLLAIDSADSKVQSLRVMMPTDSVFSPMRTDCYPVPPYIDSTTPRQSAGWLTLKTIDLNPYLLLDINRDTARYAFLVDRGGRLTSAGVSESSGSTAIDRLVIAVAARLTLPTVKNDGEPVCSWTMYDVALPEPPRDSLLASFLETSVGLLDSIPWEYRIDALFFSVRTQNVNMYSTMLHLGLDSVATQRKIDSIMFERWPKKFKSLTWRQQKNKPEYFKEWEKQRKRR